MFRAHRGGRQPDAMKSQIKKWQRKERLQRNRRESQQSERKRRKREESKLSLVLHPDKRRDVFYSFIIIQLICHGK